MRRSRTQVLRPSPGLRQRARATLCTRSALACERRDVESNDSRQCRVVPRLRAALTGVDLNVNYSNLFLYGQGGARQGTSFAVSYAYMQHTI